MLKLVEYDRTFLDLSMKWLSDPEIASLVMVPSFTKVQQECFFNSLPTRENYYIKGLIYNGYPIGAAGIKNIYKEKGEYWGYIGEKQFWGKGIGKDIIRLIINNAKILGLTSWYLNVHRDNERAQKLYEKYGFISMSVRGSVILMERSI